jgi:hypothetical protein
MQWFTREIHLTQVHALDTFLFDGNQGLCTT